MRWSESQSPERRQDVRVRPSGTVRVVPLGRGDGSDGRLVDVCARGLCVEAPRLGLRVGQPVALEIALDTAGVPATDPRCVLEGTGRVVWARTERRACRAGLRFDRPVAVKAPFGAG